jgi:hypothetical protein
MRFLLLAGLLTGLAFSAHAQYPDQPRRQTDEPIVIRQAPSDSGDVDPLVQEENPLKYMKFRERILLGGGINNLVFSNTFTVIGVAPQVGYQLTPSDIIGVNGSYTYYSQKIFTGNGSSFREKSNLIGVGLFGRHQLTFLPENLRSLFAQAGVEQYWYLTSGRSYNFKPAFLAGLGINLGGMQITALYNVNYDDIISPFPSPLVLRIGGFFTGPQF